MISIKLFAMLKKSFVKFLSFFFFVQTSKRALAMLIFLIILHVWSATEANMCGANIDRFFLMRRRRWES